MKDYRKSRGWRNNNPLNIRRGERWQGLVSTPGDPQFCQFQTMAFGYRAGAKVLRSYFRYFQQKGIPFSVRNIINRWAPPRENDTEAYVCRVCHLMTGDDCRQASDVELSRPDTPQGARHLASLMAAMTCVECGCQPQDVDYHAIAEGVWWATSCYLKISDIVL